MQTLSRYFGYRALNDSILTLLLFLLLLFLLHNVLVVDIMQAADKMKAVTNYFNEQKKDAENVDYVAKLYGNMVFDESLDPSCRRSSTFRLFGTSDNRRFIKEGDVLVVKKQSLPKVQKPLSLHKAQGA